MLLVIFGSAECVGTLAVWRWLERYRRRNIMRNLLIAISLVASPTFAAEPLGKETVITNVGNGGLRDWQAGPPRSGVLYVRDRTNRWYRVTLTGPCITDRALDTLTYTTDSTGAFDRFSRINVARYPKRVCGVRSIQTSLPPKGQPPARRR